MKSTRVATTSKTDKTYVKKQTLANMPKLHLQSGEERHRYLSPATKPKKNK